METCIGCGAQAPEHPMVAIVSNDETQEWEAAPTCDACWRDPSHRTNLIKGHFFTRAQRVIALRYAGSTNIG